MDQPARRRFTNSIRVRFFMAFALVLVLTMGAVLVVTRLVARDTFVRFEDQQARSSADRVALVMERLLAQRPGTGTLDAAVGHLEAGLGEWIWITSRHGSLVAGSRPPRVRPGPELFTRPLHEPGASAPLVLHVLLRHPHPPDRTRAGREFLAKLGTRFLTLVILALLVALVLTGTAVRVVTRPLAAVREAVRRFRSGDHGVRVDLAAAGDIEGLGTSFNEMAAAVQSDEERRTRLLADVAHELRTPLAIVKGYLEGIADGVLEPGQIREVRDEVDHLADLVDDLQDSLEAPDGSLRFEPGPVRIDLLLRSVAAAAEPAAAARGLALATDLEPASAWCDERRTRQVVENLLGNALRHTPSAGEILLGCRPEAQGVVIRVHDTGEGIDPADLPYIFERFYRVDPVRSRRTGGSGLGLAIVRNWVQRMDGRVEVASERGRGTRVTVWLPAAGGAKEPLAARAATEA